MAAKSGQYAALFKAAGTSTAATDKAMTRVGTTSEFYITDRTMSWWDMASGKTPVFYLDSVAIDADDISEIDYAAGFVTLRSYTSGTVTCDIYYFTPAAFGGVFGVDLQPKAETKEITTFSQTLNVPIKYRSWIKTLNDWQGTVERHFFTGHAWKLMDCTNNYSDLYWTLKEWGRPGNLRQVEYIVSGNNTALDVAYNAGSKKFTVTVATDGSGVATSTAKDIKDHVEADAVLAALVDVTYKDAAVAASKIVDCTNPNSDILWTWRTAGVVGNAEDIEYIVSGNNTPLSITYAAHKITVHVATDAGGAATSTAAEIIACAHATAAINAIVSSVNAPSNDGSGVVEAKSAADFAGGVDAGSGIVEAKTAGYMAGGEDLGSDLALVGQKILFRLYLNITTGSLEMMSGLCHLTGVPIDVKLESIQESNLSLQGIGRLKYHTV